jgi:hypothetical protein
MLAGKPQACTPSHGGLIAGCAEPKGRVRFVLNCNPFQSPNTAKLRAHLMHIDTECLTDVLLLTTDPPDQGHLVG